MSLDVQHAIEVCRMVADDMKNDMSQIDGQPFNGKTVATQLGNQAAAIAVLAKIIDKMLSDRTVETPPRAASAED